MVNAKVYKNYVKKYINKYFKSKLVYCLLPTIEVSSLPTSGPLSSVTEEKAHVVDEVPPYS